MNKAMLNEVLTAEEVNYIRNRKLGIPLSGYVDLLTWRDLVELGLVFIANEYDGICPGGPIARIAIDVITSRCIEKNLTIH